MSLEFFRRVAQEYDRYILKRYIQALNTPEYQNGSRSEERIPLDGTGSRCSSVSAPSTFQPTVIQQAVRATLHMTQFAIAYFIMLLAMYYNAYIILSIIIGAWLGAFVFNWQNVSTR
jgi:copper transporter 1